MLRKIAFKLYEKKRFINEKREIIEKSVSNKSKYSNKLKKRTARFNKKSSRKSSEVISNIQSKILNLNEHEFTLDKKQTVPGRLHELEDYKFDDILSNEPVSEEDEDQLTIIESVVKYAVQ